MGQPFEVNGSFFTQDVANRYGLNFHSATSCGAPHVPVAAKSAEWSLDPEEELEYDADACLLAAKNEQEIYNVIRAAKTYPANVLRLFDDIVSHRVGLHGLTLVFEPPICSLESFMQDVAADGAVAGDELLSLASDVISGVSFLHTSLLLHRSICPENIFLCPRHGCEVSDDRVSSLVQTRAKLGGFGQALRWWPERVISDVIDRTCHSAPEIRDFAYGPSSDLYSVASVIGMVACQKVPVPNDDLDTWETEAGYDEERLKRVVRKGLYQDKDARATLSEFVESMKGYDDAAATAGSRNQIPDSHQLWLELKHNEALAAATAATTADSAAVAVEDATNATTTGIRGASGQRLRRVSTSDAEAQTTEAESIAGDLSARSSTTRSPGAKETVAANGLDAFAHLQVNGCDVTEGGSYAHVYKSYFCRHTNGDQMLLVLHGDQITVESFVPASQASGPLMTLEGGDETHDPGFAGMDWDDGHVDVVLSDAAAATSATASAATTAPRDAGPDDVYPQLRHCAKVADAVVACEHMSQAGAGHDLVPGTAEQRCHVVRVSHLNETAVPPSASPLTMMPCIPWLFHHPPELTNSELKRLLPWDDAGSLFRALVVTYAKHQIEYVMYYCPVCLRRMPEWTGNGKGVMVQHMLNETHHGTMFAKSGPKGRPGLDPHDWIGIAGKKGHKSVQEWYAMQHCWGSNSPQPLLLAEGDLTWYKNYYGHLLYNWDSTSNKFLTPTKEMPHHLRNYQTLNIQTLADP